MLIRRGLQCAGAALAGLIILLAVLVALLNAGYFRGPLVRFLAARAERKIEVAGSLRTHLFSLHPQVIAEGVSIGNPPWSAPGSTAEIGKLTLVFDASSLRDGFRLDRLQMDAATLHLVRDSAGRANWQRTDPGKGRTRPCR